MCGLMDSPIHAVDPGAALRFKLRKAQGIDRYMVEERMTL
jgi:hypothetical protein